MPSSWRTLDFSNANGRLFYRRGKVVFFSKDQDIEKEIPLAQVAVILIGYGVSVSGTLFGKLSQLDIAVVIVDWRCVPVAGAQPWHDHSRIAARQIAQATLSEPRRKNAWARIVKSKILGQSNTLERLGIPTEARQLSILSRTVKSGDPSNVEGQAARIYWSALDLVDNFRRNPGAREDGWNGVLDYAYTLLRGQGIRALALAGLSGPLGFHHRNRSNPFALVDDLIEPFRPAVDFHLISSLQIADVSSRECKQLIFAAVDAIFDETGHSISTAQENFTHQVGLYIEGKTRFLAVPTWDRKANDDDLGG